MERIEQHNNIFICSNESWHEVRGPLYKKGRVSVPKGVGAYEHPRYEKSAPFSIRQWGTMTIRAQMGPQKIWEPETETEKEANNAILKVINENIVAEVRKKRSQAAVYGTQSMSFYELKMLRLMHIMQSIEKRVWDGKEGSKDIQLKGCLNKKSWRKGEGKEG